MATVSLPARFAAGTATTTETTVLTVPGGETDVVTSVTFDNITDSANQVTLKMAGINFAKNLDLAPRSLTVLDFKQVLNTAETITVQASVNSGVTYFISGVKITNV
jgi:hypothetical protein